MPIVAVTGLAAEAKIARRAGWRALATSGEAQRAATLIDRALAEGASGLVSFGIAGGLDPMLRPGSLLLPHAVRDEAGARYGVDPSWHDRVATLLRAAGLEWATGEILGGDTIAATPEHKRALRQKTGAVALDLESHLVAHAAARRHVPFLILRALADPAERVLPPAALIALSEDGRPALAPIARSLLRQPAQLGRLLRLAGETRRALAVLRRAASTLSRDEAASRQF